MSLVTTLAKFLGKCLGGLVAVAVTCYLLLWVVNWQDEAASERALDLKRQLTLKPVSNNGYQLYTSQLAQLGSAAIPELQQLFSDCRQAGCQSLIQAETETLQQLLAQQQQLLAAYQQWLATEHWQESPLVNTDLPAYQPLLNGQRLQLLQAYLAARQGDSELAQQLLAADLQFWRKLLPQNRYLLSKMISVAAIEQHFLFASAINQSLTDGDRPRPAIWQQPFSPAELSLELALAGEWQLSEQLIAKGLSESSELKLLQRLGVTLVKPLYQAQASSNERALLLSCEAGGQQAVAPWYHWAYNPVGKILNRASTVPCAQYLSRLERLEQSRQQLVSAGQVPVSAASLAAD